MTTSTIDSKKMKELLLAPLQELLKALASTAMRPILEDFGRLHVQLVDVHAGVSAT